MKIFWLGQAGLMFETSGMRIMVDPYFSNSCEELNKNSYRRQEVDGVLSKLQPDVLVCTHDHRDHYDRDTVKEFLTNDSSVLCLVPPSVFAKIREFGPKHNYVYFPQKTVWTEKNVKFTAVKAVHSDPDAIGVIIEAEGKKYYVTGDTLYNEEIFGNLPDGIDVLFLPVNGVGCNMNFEDARNFAKRVNAKYTVPLHLGMLDDRSVSEFQCENAVIPRIYSEIEFK